MSAINQFTVGRDLSLNVMTSGGQITLRGLTNFTADPQTTELKSKGMDGINRFGIIPDGWKGSFQMDRLDRSYDDYWAAFEANYYAGISTGAATILETIAEQDGSISQWRFEGVVLKLEKSGDFAGDKKVEQTISFMAAKKVKVS